MRGKRIVGFLLSLLCAGGLALAFVLFLSRPFPFVDMVYTQSGASFDTPPGLDARGFSYYTISGVPACPLRWRPAEGAATPGETLERVLAFVRHTMADAGGRELRTPKTIFERGGRFRRICSEYAKVLCATCQRLGLTARVVWMNHHTTSEIYFPDYGWVLADAYGNAAFRYEGRFIGLMEFRTVSREAEFVAPDTSGYAREQPAFHDGASIREFFADNELYVCLSGDSLFRYPENRHNVVAILESMVGSRRLGLGVQYTGRDGELPKVGNFGLTVLRRLQ